MTLKKNETENELFNISLRLKSFGLSAHESAMYLYLLQRGIPVGGSKIAIGTKLHRQYIYLSLPKLIGLSLVEEVKSGKQNKYKARPPQELEKISKKKLVETEDLVRDLMRFSKVGHEQDFEVTQGELAVQRYELEYARTAPMGVEEYILGGSSLLFTKVMGEHLEEYLDIKRKRNFKVKYLGSANEYEFYKSYILKYPNQEYKFMPKLPQGVTHMVMRGETVIFFSFLNPTLSYVIKSKVVTDNYKAFFLMLWDMAE